MSTLTDWTGIEPLPTGPTTLLEASAGTGKTWQIEGLVVRLVAEEGVPIDRILVITFTNAATAELRDRVRQRLVRARDALSTAAPPKDDPIIEQVWSDEGAREERRSRLAAALASFDLAPISTIHGFSQRTLDSSRSSRGRSPGWSFLRTPHPPSSSWSMTRSRGSTPRRPRGSWPCSRTWGGRPSDSRRSRER